mmetsp:Transcript_417/g.1424  ORF Transcript_417/g.1424 Transcript_417/m.1424 type:complete len:156 (+) Transcript_417:112-579(+)
MAMYSSEERNSAPSLGVLSTELVTSMTHISKSASSSMDETRSEGSHGVTQPTKLKRTRQRRRPIPDNLRLELLRDHKGTTAAAVKKMSDEERTLVLLRRQIRNRESAVRSLNRRKDFAADVDDLIEEYLERIRTILDANESLAEEIQRIEDGLSV